MPMPKSDDPRTEHITVRLTDAERKALDRARGQQSISDFFRSKIPGV